MGEAATRETSNEAKDRDAHNISVTHVSIPLMVVERYTADTRCQPSLTGDIKRPWLVVPQSNRFASRSTFAWLHWNER